MKRIDPSNYVAALAAARQPYHAKYYALYSSLLDGLVTDPTLMQLPADDHLVHRGDGVFETCKCVAGGIYNLEAHQNRLARSAATIGIQWPAGMEAVRTLTLETARAAGRPDASIRVILARGPGSFGVNPYESPTPALYIVCTRWDSRSWISIRRAHPSRRSTIPAKPSEMAEIKNCNYLPNVLMKRQAVDWGVDFAVGYDTREHLTEGPTENVGIVTRGRVLAFPRLENILAGTTMMRVAELAELRAAGDLRGIEFRDITEPEVRDAAELLIVGTTINVVAARAYEGRAVGDGRPGPVWRRLQQLLEDDIRGNPRMRTLL